jgi:hypothetical protein
MRASVIVVPMKKTRARNNPPPMAKYDIGGDEGVLACSGSNTRTV